MSYLPTIGLEVHVQLGSKTKIFCGCAVEFGSPANKNVCPVCLGLPGALPVLNQEVFRLGLRAVLALGGVPSALVKFDRKNYFYPDLPKGYQISQYDHPLGKGGFLEITTAGGIKKIRLNRLHLEEDAGKLLHDQVPQASVVDLNRAGTPLAEIVSEPDLDSADEAYEYLTALKAILKCVGVSECDMEKGQLRCDANVSVRKSASDALGTRVEIKNLNSFKSVRAAIQHEIARQSAALEKGEKISQETVLWDDARQKTVTMRSKEEAHDYRYFPEPDLVPFFVSPAELERAKKAIPELPKQKRERLMSEFNLTGYDAGQLVQDPWTYRLFMETAGKLQKTSAKDVANWIIGPGFAYAGAHATELGRTKLTADHLAELIRIVLENKASLQIAKEKLFPEVVEKGTRPEVVLKEKGLEQVSDEGQLKAWILEAIQANPKVVDDFRSGKESAAMFLVGQVMKKSQGKANPVKVKEMMTRTLQEA